MLKLIDSQSDENELVRLSLDELARLGAKRILSEALQLEVSEYIARFKDEIDSEGKRLVVRNGTAKSRKITTGAGTIDIVTPRVNDRRPGKRYSSLILPPYLRRSANVESVLPLLYLKSLSGNAFSEALGDLLGANASGLSPSSISSLKRKWAAERDKWRKRPITDKYVYVWADGVHVKVRLGEDKKLCLLVLMGATETGEKHVLAIESGYRESSESWRIVFRNLISRGFSAPMMIIGDGALGLWKAIDDIPSFKETVAQRCWVHRIANVLNKLPKRLQPQAKKMLHDMMNAARKSDAEIVKLEFIEEFKPKFPKAVKCLEDKWNDLTTFFDFPTRHWPHIRTTNPIESLFATIKQRTRATKGAGNSEVAETMAFKLALEAEKSWRRLNSPKDFEVLISGGVYKDGVIEYDPRERVAVNS